MKTRRQNPNEWLNGIRSVHSTHKIYSPHTFSFRSFAISTNTHDTLTHSFTRCAFIFFSSSELKFNAICFIFLAHSRILCFLFRQPVRVSHTNRFVHFYTLRFQIFLRFIFCCLFLLPSSTIYISLVRVVCAFFVLLSLWLLFRRNRNTYFFIG